MPINVKDGQNYREAFGWLKVSGSWRPFVGYTKVAGAWQKFQPLGYDLASFSYSGNSLSVSSEDGSPQGVALSDDGTTMFVLGLNTATIYRYTLTTAWDLSTASYDSVTLSLGGQMSDPGGLAFGDSGQKMYVVDDTTDVIHQYTLGTAWNIGTASYDNVTFDVSARGDRSSEPAFSADGTKMYQAEANNNLIHQYTLSTGWDLSTASYDNVTLNTENEQTSALALAVSDDGTRIFIGGGPAVKAVHQYSMTTPWDLSTASYDSVLLDISTELSAAAGMVFDAYGLNLYMTGGSNDPSVFQYSSS